MDDATGELSRVTVSPDGLVINVDAARVVARGMLKRTELPVGVALETTLADLEHMIRLFMVGVAALLAKENSGAFRDAGEEVVKFGAMTLNLNAHFVTDRNSLPVRYAKMVLNLAGAYDLLGGGETCPPTV